MNRRLFIIIGIVVGVLLLLLVAAALLGGSGNKKKKTQISNEQITLHYWRIDDEKSTMDPIIQNYQKQKSNIKIEYKKLERDKYEQQLVEALAAGKGPDLFQVNNTWLPRYFDKIAPIPEDMYKKEDYEREFFKAVVSDTTSHPGLPFAPDVRIHQRVTGWRRISILSLPSPGQGCASITRSSTRTKHVPSARYCRTSIVDDAAMGMDTSGRPS